MTQRTFSSILLIISAFSIMLSSCSSGSDGIENGKSARKELSPEESQKYYLTMIDSIEKKLSDDKFAMVNHGAAMTAIKLYDEFAMHFPKHPKSPDFLFKAGDISSSLNFSQPAILYFKRVTDNYPDYDKTPFALFLQAFVYENQLNDTAGARKIYNEVIAKYPQHQVAEDAKASLNHLGKTPEQIIAEFEKKKAI
jgi:TolA-binding protein